MKKLVSCVLASLMVFGLCSTNVLAEEILEVTKFDYLTGDTINVHIECNNESNISLPGSNSGNTRGIIGSDGREQVDPTTQPNCRIVCLHMGFDRDGDGIIDNWTVATGAMVARDVMLTCAHAMYWYEYGITAKEMHIHIEQNSADIEDSEYCFPYSWIIPSQYISSKDINYDWCVVKTQEAIGDETSWFGYGYASSITNKAITISGYPDVSGKQYYQYAAEGIMNSSSHYRFEHNVDTEGGQSGAPAFDSDGIIWGIHTHGLNSAGYNSGVLVTEQLYNAIESMK